MNSSHKATSGSSLVSIQSQYPMAWLTTSSSVDMLVWLWSVDASSSLKLITRWQSLVSLPWSAKAPFYSSWGAIIRLMFWLLFSLDITCGFKQNASHTWLITRSLAFLSIRGSPISSRSVDGASIQSTNGWTSASNSDQKRHDQRKKKRRSSTTRTLCKTVGNAPLEHRAI